MKAMTCLLFGSWLVCSYGWNSVPEMELDFCRALTNKEFLLSTTFSNQLVGAATQLTGSTKCEALMLLSIHSAQCFEETIDDRWLQSELEHASNAVVSAGLATGEWQYWLARFVYAGAYAHQSKYVQSYALMTNALTEISSSGFTNATTAVERALLTKFEMPDVNVRDAMKVMAGMSAAVTGAGNSATNYANQLPNPYRNTILRFVKEKE